MLINYGSCAVCFILNTTPQRMGDWEYSPDTEDTIALNKYIGSNIDVIVPNNLHADPELIIRDADLVTENVTHTKDAGSVTDSTINKLVNAGTI